jgi:FtsZ-binding cell division protein ZapB
MKHIVKNPPNKQLRYLVALVITLAAVIGLQSCKSTKVPNRIYKKLATDAVPLDNEYKKNVMAQKCNVLFPIVPITIIKDSITTKIVRVQDNNLVNKLKAELAKKCKDINIDSLYNAMPFDTIYIDHYNTKTVIHKDTTGNYFRQLNEDALRTTNNTLNAENTSLNKHIEDITKDLNEAKKQSNKWKWRFILACMAFISSWGLYGYFKLRKSLMPKI